MADPPKKKTAEEIQKEKEDAAAADAKQKAAAMMPPAGSPLMAARVGDMHVCPAVNVLVPHVGGPIMPPGVPTVLIGGMPAATATSMCTCTGPPDTITKGSATVMIGGKPAARMMDTCAHGGMIILGCPTVIIGG